jgi:hypothetical protein
MRSRTVQGIACLLCAASLLGQAQSAAGCGTEPGQQAGQTASGTGAQDGVQKGNVTEVQDRVLSQSLSREGTPSGPGAGFPTGRLMYSWHDPYVSHPASPWPAYKSETSEQSIMGSVYYKLPQPVFGANVQAGVFGGENWVNATYKPATPAHGLLSNTKQSNLSDAGGGYVLVNFGGSYVMNTAAGFEGKMNQTGYGFAGGSYGTNGFADTAVAGHVFALSEAADPLKLDVRAGVLYSNASGGNFSNVRGEVFRPSSEEWTGSLSVMLFRDFVAFSGTLRPFVKAGVKEQLAYSNKVEDSFHGRVTTYDFGESGTLGAAEAGFDYTVARVTVSGAVYGEAGADQTAVGGRLGAKIAF